MSQEPAADPLLGRAIDGRYRVHSALARGGMSRVYLAEQHPLGRTVALKVLAVGGDPSQEAEFRNRFQLEASVCARLTHPNTVRVFDHGRVGDELLYIAMEYLDGRTLHQALRAEGPLDAARIISLARQVCGSLREAHQLGLIHRDLKPANVMLMRHGDDEDFVKVLDFGLVKQLRANDELTGVDAVVGSPSYMSPEQIRAERLDVRSDIYSLGVILYACVAGRPPFQADTSVGVLLAHLNQPPPPLPAQSPALRDAPTLGFLITACLAKSPEDRFADVDEVLRALRVCEAELRGDRGPPPSLRQGRLVRDPAAARGAVARPPLGSPEPSVSTVISAIQSRPLPLLAATGAFAGFGALVGLLLVAVAGWWWWSSRVVPPAPAVDPAVAALADPGAAEAGAPGPVAFSSTPSGATVRRGDQVLGTTPMAVEIPLGEVWELTLEAPGHQAQAVRVPWDARRRQLTLLPEPAAPAEHRTPKGGSGAAAPADAPDAPDATSPADPDTPATAPARKRTGGDLKDPWAP